MRMAAKTSGKLENWIWDRHKVQRVKDPVMSNRILMGHQNQKRERNRDRERDRDRERQRERLRWK